MVQYFLSMLTWTVFFVAVERLGETELAISNIIRSIYMILLIPMHSLGLTCNSLVSNTIGAGKKEEVLPLVKRISFISLVIMVCIVTVVSLFPNYILSLYTDNTAMIEQSVASVWSISIAVLIASFGSMYFYAISGTGNTMVAFIIELITVILYSAYIFVVCLWLRASIEICFAIEILYYLMMFILSYIYLKRGKWQGKTI
ncbi:MAG: MATE family efflux transporter, partial [Bacteroides sp.]|nr:MATE family efflux transporter [Bacteroides sp.]